MVNEQECKPECEFFIEANDPPNCFDPVTEVLFFKAEESNHHTKVMFSCARHAAEFAKEAGYLRSEKYQPITNATDDRIGSMTADEQEEMLAWMGPEGNSNIDFSRCQRWIEETSQGWSVWVDLISHTGEVRTVGTKPFAIQIEAEAYFCSLGGQEA
jgi:hypothetical protein